MFCHIYSGIETFGKDLLNAKSAFKKTVFLVSKEAKNQPHYMLQRIRSGTF